jgi:hypothetical protein
MPINGLVCFLLLVCFGLVASARRRRRPKPKSQLTPWHPELVRRKAVPLLGFYLFAYGGVPRSAASVVSKSPYGRPICQ